MRINARLFQVARVMCVVFLVLCLLDSVATAQQQKDAPIARCDISSPSTTFTIDEPMVLDVRVTSLSASKLSFRNPWPIGAGPAQVYSLEPTGERWTAYAPAVQVDVSARVVELEPGEVWAQRAVLLACANSETPGGEAFFLFRRSGTYKFRLEFTMAGVSPPIPAGGWSKVISNTIEVTVREPEGREIEATKLWRAGMKRQGYDLNGFLAGDEDFGKLVEDYPDTIFGQHGVFILAATDRIMFESELQGLTPAEYQAQRLEQLMETAPEFPLRDGVMFRLAEMYRQQERYPEAAKLLEDLLVESPDSPFVEKATEQLEHARALAAQK